MPRQAAAVAGARRASAAGCLRVERELRQRRDEARGLAILGDGEAAHEAARVAGVENIENDKSRRAARDDAAFAQKCDERRPGVGRNAAARGADYG